MTWTYIMKDTAINSFAKFDKKLQERIIKKLDFFCNSPNPLFFAKRLVDSRLWTYRFRIWDYRIIFDVDENWKIIIIALIWKRWEIYE